MLKLRKIAASLALSLAFTACPAFANVLLAGGDEVPVVADPGSSDAFGATGLQLVSGFAMQQENDIPSPHGLLNLTAACVSFQNTGTKTITAVRWGIGVMDPFNVITAAALGDRAGVFSPGAVIAGTSSKKFTGTHEAEKNCWHFLAPHAARIAFRPLKVAYSDGTTWSYADSTTQFTPLPTR